MDTETKIPTTRQELRDFRVRRIAALRPQYEKETEKRFYQETGAEKIHRLTGALMMGTGEPLKLTDEAHLWMLHHLIELPEGTDLRKILERPENELALDGFTHLLEGEDLSYMRLPHADLTNAKLAQARMVGCDLSGVTLYNADIKGADLSYSNLDRAKVNSGIVWDEETNFAFVKNLNTLEGERGDSQQILAAWQKMSAEQTVKAMEALEKKPSLSSTPLPAPPTKTIVAHAPIEYDDGFIDDLTKGAGAIG